MTDVHEPAFEILEDIRFEDLATVPPSGGNGSGNGHGITETASGYHPGGFPLTDSGNAERLVARHGRDLRFVPTWNRWLYWDGVRWADDQTGDVFRRALESVRSINAEAAVIDDPDVKKRVLKHAQRSEDGGRLREVVTNAQSQEVIAALPEVFDADPMLLCCTNGTVDLRTGILRPHRREDLLRRRVGVAYLPGAPAPVWKRALERWMDGNRELIEFLQRSAGYSLTGLTSEEVIFFLYGLGRNGKSKFLAAIRNVLGEYARTVRPETLMVKQGSDIPNDIAALVGTRMVTTTEIEEGARLAESLVKQLTGGDAVSARFMRAEYFEFKPQMKIWMAGNHKPSVRGVDLAIWERILTVPFTVTIPHQERDKYLEEKLAAEAEGILAWMVEGCLAWQANGLNPPAAVTAATNEYRTEMDVLGQFLTDCCEERFEATVRTHTLYERYSDWCRASGEKLWSQQLLGRKLKERGFEADRIGGGVRIWQGIELKVVEE